MNERIDSQPGFDQLVDEFGALMQASVAADPELWLRIASGQLDPALKEGPPPHLEPFWTRACRAVQAFADVNGFSYQAVESAVYEEIGRRAPDPETYREGFARIRRLLDD